MSRFLLFALTSVMLFCIGLRGLIVHAHLLRKILALNLMSGGIFLFLVSLAYRNRTEIPDPVPQAMVLTGIVVAVSATALSLALARRIHAQTSRVALDDEEAVGVE